MITINTENIIVKLNHQFFHDYKKEDYPEVLRKEDRPYEVAVFSILPDVYIVVPFRSRIQHEYAWHFTSSKRCRKSQSGIDYTKMILLRTEQYFDKNYYIDQDERTEFFHYINEIKHRTLVYIQTYINHMTGKKLLHPCKFKRMYEFSTLPYFHDELHMIMTQEPVYRSYMIFRDRLYVAN